ncbi:hypothetical protein HH214_00705 [Mucilaginibacter robiniae]|uniref:Uncharacterized protein n=1 Tax=Mucilaginibacter robiniae TaxID=2728022 RepID=A0A7L5DUV4_9SPHI|nr:hypothetical protein [Mucilaginibacter robiniae]QJD94491.1 hypothetical protein HH214_00705 [Mucilaginibacter robiniae]
MKAEKMVMLTGKEYQEIKQSLETQSSYTYNVGTVSQPETVKITDIYLDTDPEFTRNPKQYAKVHDDKSVQVRIEYEA